MAEHPDRMIFVAQRPEEVELFFTPAARERLSALGSVDYAPDAIRVVPPTDLGERYDAVVTGWSTDSDQGRSFRGSRLHLVAHTAGSIRTVTPRSVLDNGIRVTQAGVQPMANAVAEFALALTLSLLRHLHTYDRQLQASRDWVASRTPEHGLALEDRHVGIVGLSRVGRRYLEMVKSLGVTDISVYDPYVSQEIAEEQGFVLADLDDVFGRCDVVAIHAPVTDQTRRMIGADQLALLPDDGVLINTARSAVVDQAALLAELRSGRIRAGLDVFDTEPLPSTSPFYGLPNVIVTPHVAGATVEARHAMGDSVVDELTRFFSGEPLIYEVTPTIYDQLA